ncbi:MAG: flavodoxin family protein [Methanomicrobiales archaeon]|nr:flavodoxin family protein [Methanomicrobiales archaeon]
MQVVGISGSMRKDGNTARLVRLILDQVKASGIKTEYITLADKVIKPCLGCENCKEERSCVIQNDDWYRIIKKVLACEVLILGSPTYYYDVNGQTKNFIDRTYSLYHDRQLAGRRAVGVAVCADKGGKRALQTMEGFFNSHEFSYLGQVLGKGYLAGEVLENKAAVQAAERIGQKIVRLMRPQD